MNKKILLNNTYLVQYAKNQEKTFSILLVNVLNVVMIFELN